MIPQKLITEKWIKETSDPARRRRILELRQRYEFLSEILFREYEPTRRMPKKAQRDFMSRLDRWLKQFENKNDAINAYNSIEYLFFRRT